VPHAARAKILEILHVPHAGIAKTRESARETFYWPGINSDIENMVKACDACRKFLPSQQREPMQICEANRPMEKMGADLFESGGTKWLVMVDRYSGYTWTKQLTKTSTRAVTSTMEGWFSMFGLPDSIRTDGGPQFRTEFIEWCENKGIDHELSSAYNPNSNGLAEAAVKTTKYLLEKCRMKKQNLDAAMLEARCTPRADGISPAEAMFGRRPKSALPRLSRAAGDKLQVLRAEKTKELHDKRASGTDLPKLQKGQAVMIQDPTSGKWSGRGVVSRLRNSGRSYEVETNGWTTTRARRFLRPMNA